MEDSWLRWKGRIGSLKLVALFGIIGAFIGLVWSTTELPTARANPSEPRVVTIAQLVNDEVDRSVYVTVKGYAMYQTGYEETTNGRKTAEFYFLFDMDDGYAVLVEADHMDLDEREDGVVSIAGMTAFPSTSPDLYVAISDDVKFFLHEGFRITPDIYVRENARPTNEALAISVMVLSAVLGLASLVAVAFPRVVFSPAEAQPGGVAQQGGVRQGVQVTGRLQQLKRVEPTIEVGRKWRKFTTAVANVIPLADRRVMIYVHYIYRYNGIKVQDTHWGVTLDTTNVESVEPGKILRFKDRWAVRFVHIQRRNKPETLIVSFARPEDQAHFVALLRAAGFAVGDVGIASYGI